MIITLVPAYGRDYASQKDVREDWEAGKDFRVAGGPYINKQDAVDGGIRTVNIRYNDATRVLPVDVK